MATPSGKESRLQNPAGQSGIIKTSVAPSGILQKGIYLTSIIWEFTESNFSTFVIPNTAFGLFGSFAAAYLTNYESNFFVTMALQRLPLVMAFNWFNVFVFDLANQRSVESVQEDILNKPWRPIPSGRITTDQTRRLMLVAVPIVLLFNYWLGVWKQGIFIHILVWLYNDIRGGDEIVRDLIISIAYGLFNSASLILTIGEDVEFTKEGVVWICMISGVILTTMQVQDLKDQVGDRTRGRKTVALFLGEQVSRFSIAAFICFWNLAFSFFWKLHYWAIFLPAATGSYVAFRVLWKTTPTEDSITWKTWCIWTITLYTLPAIYHWQHYSVPVMDMH
jgi:4-hydroxybenzoate polyprenyltransferase